ncbi:MAG: PepSY-like domain-containing protein [Bacteroidales bacterium]|nr:PepSY-like domain-containing protein [Bacteroidales bacterium]
MKKSFLFLTSVLALIFCFAFTSKADDDRVITFAELPATAQTMLKQHFADKVPLIITADWDDYKVTYETGEKVEFNKQGDWKEIECRGSLVPDAFIPEQIKAQVKSRFPGNSLIQIKKDRRGWETKLSNGLEIEFDKNFRIVDIDD